MRNSIPPKICKACQIRAAAQGGLCKPCQEEQRKQAKRAAKEKLAVATVTDLRKYADLPRPEREALHAAVEAPKIQIGPSDEDKAVKALRRWRKEPWTYVREVFSTIPDLWQDEVLHAVVGLKLDGTPLPPDQPYDKIALKACKGPGKTCVEAWIAWWFLQCFDNPKVVATSITGENLRDNLWTEMAKWQAISPLLTQLFEWKTERIELRSKPETWFMSARTWPKDADKTQQANSLAGIHARNTLLIIDESGDVPEGVLAAGLAHHSTQGSGGAPEIHITLQAGNPTRLDGALGIACTRDRAKWWVKEITGDPKDPHRAPRMDIKWCQDQIDAWGPDFPWVLVNVFGKFPPIQDDKLLGPEQVRAAMQLVIEPGIMEQYPRVAGLDVARSMGSDRSVLCRRQGPVVFPFKVWRIDNADDLISQVAFVLAPFKPAALFVDSTGVGGPVGDRLNALGFNVIHVYFGNPPRDRRFADKRTEIWWTMADQIKGKPGLALPGAQIELVPELTGPFLKFNNKTQAKLESKDEMKKRGVGSPDIADALACTFAEPIMAPVVVSGQAQEALQQSAAGQTLHEYDPYAQEAF